MSTSTAVEPKKPRLNVGENGLQITGMEELFRFAGMVASTPGFAPKGMEKPESICVAIQFGFELGLSPMQALQSLAVINGRPSIYGDAAKALIESSGLMEEYKQWYEIDGKKLTTGDGYPRTPTQAELKNESLIACVMSKRKGREPMVHTFSIGDAKAAVLLGKAGPWVQYTSRMLMWRARGFNLRDNFGDVLKGLHTAEETRDLPQAGEFIEAESNQAQTVVDRLRSRLAEAEVKDAAIEPEAATIETAAPVEGEIIETDPLDLESAIAAFADAGGIFDEFAERANLSPKAIKASRGEARATYAKMLADETEILRGAK